MQMKAHGPQAKAPYLHGDGCILYILLLTIVSPLLGNEALILVSAGDSGEEMK